MTNEQNMTKDELKNILKKMTGVSFTDEMIEDLRKEMVK